MAEIMLFGPVGWSPMEDGITAERVAAQLDEAGGEEITLRVHSPGGDVYDGIAIMNLLRAYPGQVVAILEGICASAASFIVAGGADHVVARPHAEIMVHNAWTGGAGNGTDLRKMADDLDRITNSMANIYAEATGRSVEEWLDMMEQETWFTAAEALEVGLVDVVEDARQPVGVAAQVRPQVFATYREKFKYAGRAAAPAPIVAHDGQKGGPSMGALENLAQELGVAPTVLKTKLRDVFAMEITVTSTVDVSYPETVQVVPTGRVTADVVGEVPPGLTFTIGETPEGWVAEVGETTGTVTITAPAGVEPGAEVMIPVNVTPEGGEPVEIPLIVTVKAAAEDPAEVTAPETPAGEPGVPGETVAVPVAFYKELISAYNLNKAEIAARREKDLEDEARGWLERGKFVAAMLPQAIQAIKADPETARRTWGALPDGAIPRGEVGYDRSETKTPQDSLDGLSKEEKVKALIEKANQNRNSKAK